MRSIVDLLGSVRAEVPPVADTGPVDDGTGDDGDPSLFHCPDCDRVYVAVEKETCADCETAVDSVPSTFAET